MTKWENMIQEEASVVARGGEEELRGANTDVSIYDRKPPNAKSGVCG
jgi:hypothetical protein